MLQICRRLLLASCVKAEGPSNPERPPPSQKRMSSRALLLAVAAAAEASSSPVTTRRHQLQTAPMPPPPCADGRTDDTSWVRVGPQPSYCNCGVDRTHGIQVAPIKGGVDRTRRHTAATCASKPPEAAAGSCTPFAARCIPCRPRASCIWQQRRRRAVLPRSRSLLSLLLGSRRRPRRPLGDRGRGALLADEVELPARDTWRLLPVAVPALGRA
jgi:hypothetical protein